MQVTEIHYEDVDWSQFPYGLADSANDISLKADKDRTVEQREHFKELVLKDIQADRLMMAQEVELFIVGAAAHYVTPWGGPPVTGRAFEEDVIDTLIEASNGDPFVIHALAQETAQRAIHHLLQQTHALQPLAPGEQPRRLTHSEVEAVIAEKASVVQATIEKYAEQQGPLWKAMVENQQKRGQRHRSHRKSKKHKERETASPLLI